MVVLRNKIKAARGVDCKNGVKIPNSSANYCWGEGYALIKRWADACVKSSGQIVDVRTEEQWGICTVIGEAGG